MKSRCESCLYYEYDEDDEQYLCTVSLDEDEMMRFLSRNSADCPYYHDGDEYKTVRKQN